MKSALLTTITVLVLLIPGIAAGQWSWDGTDVYLTDNNDNVGIGVTHPATGYRVEIDGHFKSDGLRTNVASSYVNVIGGKDDNTVGGSAWGVTISGGGAGGGNKNEAHASWATIGGGYDNYNAGTGATISGGTINTLNAGSYSTIGGGQYNINSLYSDWTVISGGYSNDTQSDYATVSGGYNNTASGNSSSVCGGYQNTAAYTYSSIGGGRSNYASASYSTIGGGYNNYTTGTYSTIPGGRNNWTQGDYSFATGYQAYALDDGAVVFNDQDGSCSSDDEDQFKVCADYEVRFVTPHLYVTGDIDVDHIHYHSPYPESLDVAYESVMSLQRLPDGLYDQDDTHSQLDHSNMHPFIGGINHRGEVVGELIATTMAQNEVIKDLIARIILLEETCARKE
jgi:hypothetical protein